MLAGLTLLAAVLASFTFNGACGHPGHLRDEVVRGASLPGEWFHEENHPVVNLFRRQDPSTLPPVGSDIWANQYPNGIVGDPNALPAAWVAALNAAVAAGKIPNIPTATTAGSYPGVNAGDPSICSATVMCRAPGDIWDAPAGMIGISFDDGPLTYSTNLYNFLHAQNVKATHFMIGENIKGFPQVFLQAFQNGDDISVHTYTHPQMTTLNNWSILGELGWTMQIIHDSTGGRVPRFWRPPYGDADNRVRAIAKEVFGLTTVVWNQDTSDWQMLSPGGPTPQQVAASLAGWMTGPKTPGLIILEHELSDLSVQAFINNFPLIGQNGWEMHTIGGLFNLSGYQNAADSTGPVTSAGILVVTATPTPTTNSTPAASATNSTSATPSPVSHTNGGKRTTVTSTRMSILTFGALAALLL